MRLLLFLVGFGLSVVGFMYIIMYLNYLSIGYAFGDYIKFIISKLECLLAPIGLLLIFISLFIRRKLCHMFMI